jgi:pilus assembly protein Flp/PilA
MVESWSATKVGSSARVRVGGLLEERAEMNLLKQFMVEEDGPTAVEYAVMLSLIVVVCIVAVRAIGTSASSTFNRVSTEIQAQ